MKNVLLIYEKIEPFEKLVDYLSCLYNIIHSDIQYDISNTNEQFDFLLIKISDYQINELKTFFKKINIPIIFLINSLDNKDEVNDKFNLFLPHGFITDNFDNDTIALTINSAVSKYNIYSKKIKELEETRLQLQNINNFLNAIIDNVNVWISVLDENRNFLLWNEAGTRITGYSREEAIGSNAIIRKLYDDEQYYLEVQNKIKHHLETGSNDPIEITIKRKDGKKVHINLCTKYVEDYNSNKKHRVIIAYEITQLVQKKEELRKSLEEKDILLKEIHHRVKNNLQIINSLINLQMSTLKDEETIALFREAQHRIKTMALIHEKLYQSRDFTNINFKEYIEKLVNELFHTFNINQNKIKLILKCEDIYFSINTSITLGLMINEIITNTLKYAFPENRKGSLIIELKKISKDTVKLLIQDDGVGFPENFDPQRTESLGMQLINSLAEQINAKINISSNKGVKFTFEIPIS